MKPRRTPIIGASVPDQSKLRPPRPMRDLDEFLEYLGQLQALFGVVDTPRPLTTGDHFRL